MTPSELRQHLDRQARRLAERTRGLELAEDERHELAALRLWAVVTGVAYLAIAAGLLGLAWWWAGGW